MNRTLIAAAGVLAAGFLAIPLARADGNIDEFNQYLISHGIMADVAMNGLTYMQNGQNACAAMRNGATQDQAEGQLLRAGMDRAGASDVAFAAHHYLCP